MKEIVDAGKIRQEGYSGITFDPNRSLAQIDTLAKGGTDKLLFPGGELDGMARIMQDARRVGELRGPVTRVNAAEKIGESAVLGRTNIGVLDSLWYRANAPRLTKLFTNPGGSKFLRALAGSQYGSDEYKMLMKQLPTILNATGNQND